MGSAQAEFGDAFPRASGAFLPDHGIRRPADNRKALVSRCGKPRDEASCSVDLIANDRVHCLVLKCAVVEHKRYMAPFELGDMLRRKPRCGDDAVDLVFPNLGDNLINVSFVQQCEKKHAHSALPELLASSERTSG